MSSATSAAAGNQRNSHHHPPPYSPRIPEIHTRPPLLSDPLRTESSLLQDATVEECLPYLRGEPGKGGERMDEHGLPPLNREEHAGFLADTLEEMPHDWVSVDASRPWILYWAFCGLCVLGKREEVRARYRER